MYVLANPLLWLAFPTKEKKTLMCNKSLSVTRIYILNKNNNHTYQKNKNNNQTTLFWGFFYIFL